MISEQIKKALNDQITAEFSASKLYLQMSAWLDNHNYEGFSLYLQHQSEDENRHGLKIYEYVLDQLGIIELQEIKAPKINWESCEEIFNDVLEQERQVTALINNLVKLAMAEGDVATISFLQWFINEQISSEREASFNLLKIQMIDSDIGALLEFDEKLGEKTQKLIGDKIYLDIMQWYADELNKKYANCNISENTNA